MSLFIPQPRKIFFRIFNIRLWVENQGQPLTMISKAHQNLIPAVCWNMEYANLIQTCTMLQAIVFSSVSEEQFFEWTSWFVPVV